MNEDDEVEKSFEDWWNNDLDDIERKGFNGIMEECEENDIPLIMPISIEQYAEENDKLKAEIEQLKEDYSVLARQYNNVENSSIRYYNEVKQLKSEIEQWQSTNLKLVCELTRIECENNQLKSELEQSDLCDGCKHNFDRNEYYCDSCKRISVDNFE